MLNANYKKGFYDGVEISCKRTYDEYLKQNKKITLNDFVKESNNEMLDEYKKGFIDGIQYGIDYVIDYIEKNGQDKAKEYFKNLK